MNAIQLTRPATPATYTQQAEPVVSSTNFDSSVPSPHAHGLKHRSIALPALAIPPLLPHVTWLCKVAVRNSTRLCSTSSYWFQMCSSRPYLSKRKLTLSMTLICRSVKVTGQSCSPTPFLQYFQVVLRFPSQFLLRLVLLNKYTAFHGLHDFFAQLVFITFSPLLNDHILDSNSGLDHLLT